MRGLYDRLIDHRESLFTSAAGDAPGAEASDELRPPLVIATPEDFSAGATCRICFSTELAAAAPPSLPRLAAAAPPPPDAADAAAAAAGASSSSSS